MPRDPGTPELPAGALPHTAAALRTGQLEVLAVGSGTMLGPRGRPEGSFADHMVQGLREAMPAARIRLTLLAERGMTAAAMTAAIARALEEHRYALVLWQTGTVEAVRKLPPPELGRRLDEGAAAVRQAGADLVLIDPQFSRMLDANADLSPYHAAMREAAARAGAVLFHRYDLIRGWAASGELDLESATAREREHVIGRLNACLGRALAGTVLHAAGLERGPRSHTAE
jgi:hypothetical protein